MCRITFFKSGIDNMGKYGVIILKKGRGGGAALLMLATLAYPSSLSLDSTQDIFDVTKTMNEVVGEVVKNLTPTDLFNTGTNLPLNLPLNPLNHIKGFGISAIDTDTTDLDLTRFFSPAGVSSGDLTSVLKGVAVLSIQIFIVVVQVVWEIVQGLQGALNS
mgnify:CR=1 FL=1